MTIEELQAKMMRWSIGAPKAVEKVLKTAAEIVRKSAQSDFMGSRFTDPGHEMLWVQTGRLRRSIAIEVSASPGEYKAKVGTNVVYAAIHEFGGPIRRSYSGMAGMRLAAETGSDIGTHYMPARPYLRPALNVNHSRIFKMIEEANFSAYV